ncbi:hypothetical protein BDW62DRAFT_190392 [Aspergillus aurantiobrunneus]
MARMCLTKSPQVTKPTESHMKCKECESNDSYYYLVIAHHKVIYEHPHYIRLRCFIKIYCSWAAVWNHFLISILVG